MKFSIRIILFLLLMGGAMFLFLPLSVFPSFYDVRYMGWSAVVGAASIFLIPKFFSLPHTVSGWQQKNYGVNILQYFLVWAIGSNALGDIGLYELYTYGFEFDKVIHFFTPLLAVLCIAYFLHLRFSVPYSRSRRWAVFITLVSILLWEGYEYGVDAFAATHLYGVRGSDVYHDTTFDIFFGMLGAGAGFLWHSFLSPQWLFKICTKLDEDQKIRENRANFDAQ